MIEALTGRVPREMKILNNAASVEEFRETRTGDFEVALSETFKTLDSKKKILFIANLDKLIGYRLLDNTRTKFDEEALDAGLIYKELKPGSYKALSLVAFDSLLWLLLENVKSEVRPVSSFVRSNLFLNQEHFQL